MKDETKKYFELFLEKMNYLQSLSYFQRGDSITSMKVTKKEDGRWEVDFDLPSNEQRDALLFTLRMFVQDRDGISIRSLSRFYDDPGLSESWKNNHAEVRKYLINRLNETSISSPEIGKLSHKDVFEIYLYGYLGHLNEDKYDIFNKLTQGETQLLFFEDSFHQAVIYYLAGIQNIAELIKRELNS